MTHRDAPRWSPQGREPLVPEQGRPHRAPGQAAGCPVAGDRLLLGQAAGSGEMGQRPIPEPSARDRPLPPHRLNRRSGFIPRRFLPIPQDMTAWSWVLLGVAALIVVPTLLGLAIARILGRIASDVTQLLEQEEWSTAPLTRMLVEPVETGERVSPAPAADSSHQRS